MKRPPPPSHRSLTLEGTDGIDVQLWTELDSNKEAEKVAAFYYSTWGDLSHPDEVDVETGSALEIAQMVAEGKALPNCLESVELTFGISGISRACTHQLVRSRVGVGFGQQGGRDNNWYNYNLRLPETFAGLHHREIDEIGKLLDQLNVYYDHIITKRDVPFQDARYILPMGLTTNLVATYNLLALKGTLQRRLCNRMMWETNFVARLMHDLTVQALPWVGRSLRSPCETRGVCGSVSPMFPPACWCWNGNRVMLATDNPTLEAMVGGKYEWLAISNGCYLAFCTLDQIRVEAEGIDPNVVLSMLNGQDVLARKVNGIWEREVA